MPGRQYVDDPNIRDEAELWRRLIPNWIVRDDKTGGVRVSTAAFDDSRDGSPLSVVIADVVVATHRTAENIIAGYAGYGLAAITAGAVRASRQGVMPTPEPDEPAHASVFGPKTGSNKKAMAKAARLLINPVA